jgi:UTP--glucose-1-phosphate uridylyltransferase
MPLSTFREATEALRRFGFSAAVHDEFVTRAMKSTSNAVRGTLCPVPNHDILELPALKSIERDRLRTVGSQLIRHRKVGVVILAGGMATRFGGVVKAVVPALGDRSFLQLKHHDIAAFASHIGAEIPTFVMSSFATDDGIRKHIGQHNLNSTAAGPVEVFAQMAALRLTPHGQLFREADGNLSPYATGHGDFTFALRTSGVLERFRAAGGTMLFLTNVDNLGATLDPALVGLHHEHGGEVTAEVVQKLPGAVGGAPAMLNNVAQIIEGFRFPPDFDQSMINVFNTNTLLFNAAAIDRNFPLPYYRVEKQVNGATALQFERLVGEVTAHVQTKFVRVEQSGPDCRFFSIKEPGDLARYQALIAELAASKRSFGS